MAISNLLTSFKPSNSLGTQTTTYNGVKPLSFNSPQPSTYTAYNPTPTNTNTGLVQTPPQQTYTPPSTTYTPPANTGTTPQPQPTGGLFQSVATSLAGRATQPSPMTTEAQKAYEQAIQDKLKFERSAIETKKNIYDAPTSARVMQGRDAAVQQANAETRAALQGAINQQQSAIGYGQAQQGLEQGALQQAGSLVQPSQNFPFVFNPETSSFSAPGVAGGAAGGLSYNPQTDAQSFAQKVINHQIPYADAVRALGYAGPIAEGLLQQAITSGGGNLTQLQAQTGIQTTQEQQVSAYESALKQGQNLQSQLTDLITHFGLNPSDLRAANVAVQQIANQTSDPRYALLQNYINDVANTYSQVLTPPGGSATDYTRNIAASMLDEAKKGTSIIDIMKGLDNAAQAKIAGVRTITPTGGSSSSTGGSEGWY